MDVHGEKNLDNLLKMFNMSVFTGQLVEYLRRAEQQPRSLKPEEYRHVRGMLICGLQRLYILDDWIIRNMTLDDLLGARKLEEGHVVSVQATDGQIVHFMLAPDIHLFLTLYIRYVRYSVPGDHNPSAALVFPQNTGDHDYNLHVVAQRFTGQINQQHYTCTEIRQVWNHAVMSFQDPDLLIACMSFQDQTLFIPTDINLINQLKARQLVQGHLAFNKQQINPRRCTPSDSQQDLVRSILEQNPQAKPNYVRKRCQEQYGIEVSLSLIQKIKPGIIKAKEESSIRHWLETQQCCPNREVIRQYIKDHNLTHFTQPAKARTIQGWWVPPPPSLGTRKEEAQRKKAEGLEEDDRISQAIACGACGHWPGLAVAEYLPDRGRGMFATQQFRKGQALCHYHGNVLSGKDARNYIQACLKDTSRDTSYLMEWENNGTKYAIDALCEDHSQGRLLNHSSKHPNIRKLHHLESNRVVLLFVANVNIEVGEELLYDYGQRSAGGVRPKWLDPTCCACRICKPSL
jgi:hypothetical protein